MSNSLRDQLLKAGLVDEKKLRQSRQEKKNHGRKQKGGKGTAPAAHGGSAAEQARRQQAERSRELNRNQQEAAARKALAAQIRQIIETHRVARDGELTYHFQHGNKVRRIHVNQDQHERLSRGQLGIVTLSGGYELLPLDALEKVRERDAARVVLCNEPGGETRSPAADDPYAGYEIPDDLVW